MGKRKFREVGEIKGKRFYSSHEDWSTLLKDFARKKKGKRTRKLRKIEQKGKANTKGLCNWKEMSPLRFGRRCHQG